VVNSIFFIAYSLGNIVSPQSFLQTEAPRYETGIAVTLASFVINIVLFGCLYLVYRWENNRRDKAAEFQPELSEDEKTRLAFSDLTDNENKTMRYTM
jgi:MFS transporter, ACS family, allantoate permease